MDMWIYKYMYLYIYYVNQGAHIRIYMKNCMYGYMKSFYCLPCIQGFKFI